MSAADPNLTPDAPAGGAGGGGRRAASVTLSQGQEVADASALMDPANQSLADALKITFRLVQLAMLVLGVLYGLSGFQSVKENEQAIRLLFGARESDQVEPGFRFSYPAPMGELVKVNTGQEDIDLDSSDDFWVYLGDQRAKETPIEKLAVTQQLNPEREGSVLTGDGNIAHTKWKVAYSRDPRRVALYAENMLPGDNERRIVTAAVKRGVVQAVAQVTIDDLLKQATGEGGRIASNAKEIAQGVLDRLKSGIVIDRLLLTDKMPPLSVRDKFAEVQASESKASQERDVADSQRKQTLAEAAGSAAGPLITLIGRYEAAVEKKDASAKDMYLTAINEVFEGREVKVADLEFAAGLVSGEVTSLLSEARQYRADNVNRARSDLSRYQAMLSQFKTSPQVLVNREWADSMRVFLGRDFVQVMLAPKETTTMVLKINSDPMILKEIEEMYKARQLQDAAEKRAIKQKEEQHKLQTGIKATPN